MNHARSLSGSHWGSQILIVDSRGQQKIGDLYNPPQFRGYYPVASGKYLRKFFQYINVVVKLFILAIIYLFIFIMFTSLSC